MTEDEQTIAKLRSTIEHQQDEIAMLAFMILELRIPGQGDNFAPCWCGLPTHSGVCNNLRMIHQFYKPETTA